MLTTPIPVSYNDFALHPKAEFLPHLPVGTLARLDDRRLLAIGCPGPGQFLQQRDNQFALYHSGDDGHSWESVPLRLPEHDLQPAPTGALLCTTTGTIVLAFSNLKERHFTWNDALRDAPGSVLPTWVMRSRDGGRTWTSVQKLHSEWTGAIRSIIQTADGRVLFTSMKMLSNPGRHAVLTYASADDGETWEASNLIDLGGNGHHGGVTESAVVELKDRRILQYLRTNWGHFWRVESQDGGRSWHPYGPSPVAASSAPCALKRLASGRIAIAWNRPGPRDGSRVSLRGGDGILSATPVSNFRRELSLAFSEDDGASWSDPIVVASSESEVSYPQIFEAHPGELWLTAHRWNFRAAVRESDFLQ